MKISDFTKIEAFAELHGIMIRENKRIDAKTLTILLMLLPSNISQTDMGFTLLFNPLTNEPGTYLL